MPKMMEFRENTRKAILYIMWGLINTITKMCE